MANMLDINNILAAEIESLENIQNGFDSIISEIKKYSKRDCFPDARIQNPIASTLTGCLTCLRITQYKNPVAMNKLFDIMKISKAEFMVWNKYCGNLPYLSQFNTIVPEKPRNCDYMRALLIMFAERHGYTLTENDLEDINPTNWKNQVQRKLQELEKEKDLDIKKMTSFKLHYDE